MGFLILTSRDKYLNSLDKGHQFYGGHNGTYGHHPFSDEQQI